MNRSMKEGLLMAAALGLAIVAAEALTTRYDAEDSLSSTVLADTLAADLSATSNLDGKTLPISQ